MSEIICFIIMAALKCSEVCDVSGQLVKCDIISSNLWKYKKCIMWDESGPEFLYMLVLYIMQFDGFLIPLGKIFGLGQSMQ